MNRTVPAEEPARGVPSRNALAALSLSMLLSSLGTSIANVALPAFANAFEAPFQQVQWVLLSYLLTITALIVGAGRLGDMVGRRRLLLGGIGLFAAASALSGAAPTLWVLIFARAAQGAGAAVMMALAMSFVPAILPRRGMGRMIGLLGTMSAIGTALGPSLGGILISGLGWRAIFLVQLPLAMLALHLARSLPPDIPAKDARTEFDIRGTFLLALTLTAYALSATLGRGAFRMANLALLLAAGAGLTLFIRSQLSAASPLLRLAMFREPGLRGSLLMSLLVSTVVMALLVVGPFHLSAGLGLDAAGTGLVLSAGPAAAAMAGVPTGRIVDRLGARPATMIGLSLMAAGSSGLAAMPLAFGIAGYLLATVTLTVGYSLFQTANNSAVMTGAMPAERGLTSGMLSLSRNLGLITGASLMGALFAMAAGPTDLTSAPPDAIAAAMRSTFACATILILLAGAIAAGVLDRRGRHSGPRPDQSGAAGSAAASRASRA